MIKPGAELLSAELSNQLLSYNSQGLSALRIVELARIREHGEGSIAKGSSVVDGTVDGCGLFRKR
jgi:hypothetical protein